MTTERAVVLVKKLTYSGEFGYLNNSCKSALLFTFKLALVASFLNSKFKRIFSFKRGNKGIFVSKQKNTKMAYNIERF